MLSSNPLLLLLAATASLVSAQSSASATASASAPVASGKTQIVKVGASGLVFTPENIVADVGALIEFQFSPRNHSVAESSFSKPCEPLTGSSTIYSGFHAVAAGTTDFPTYTIRVNNTNTIWLYCSQADHCQEGMVAVINAGSRSLASYKSAAKNAANNVSPSRIFGGVLGTSSQSTGTSPSGSSSGTSGGSSGASSTASGTAASAKPSSGASVEKAAGWGVAAAAALVAGLFV